MLNTEIQASTTDNQTVPCMLAGQGRKVRVTIDPTHPCVDAPVDDDTRLTYKAGAVYLANALYAQALKEDDPAATLDEIANDLPEVMTETFEETGTNEQMAAVLLPELVDRVWAFTVVAHARAEAEDGYEYVFDLMADGLKRGADAKTVRAEVPRVVEKLRASRITARIWEARDAADGPWAGILDIVLATIEKGADPQAVIDQVVGLMERVIDEKSAPAAAA